ncbi:GNAT family N-acetyltransferase [Anoxybacteroides tepidamans]|uniref:GNAT family N-acetyltransferase n=1 Tax=Anoxybacteroides tepidamans TaxID=265948 RepID=UPI000486F678|nr:GNAT family protein [Anoxybacillus tepidamans]
MFPVLKTERLILREIVKKDIEAIFHCFSNSDVTRYYGQEALTSVEQAQQLIEFFARNYDERRGIRWGIELKGKGELIGTIGFNNWVPKHKRAEIGYELHPHYWKKGYATEAVSKVISYGLHELGLTRIGAVVFIGNQASNQLLTKIGFQKEAVLRNYMYQNGVPYDVNMYALLK